MSSPILPGAILGVLGGGQLGRMFTLAARRTGYRVNVLAPEDDTPAGQIAYRETRASYDDLDELATFASEVEVITFELENVPARTVELTARHAPVRPSGRLLHTTQNRAREKGALLVNELAPRPHNSGHVTLDAHVCCLFEQQVRGVCGLPLGSVERTTAAAATANLLGDLWTGGTPDWAAALEDPGVRLHLYVKSEPRPGRKIGHLTVSDASLEAAGRRGGSSTRSIMIRGRPREPTRAGASLGSGAKV